jgi:hypothetical protein
MTTLEAITITALAGGSSAWVDVSGLRYPVTATIAPGAGGTASIETATTVAEPSAGDIESDPLVTGIAALESFPLANRVNWLRLVAVTSAASARLVQWGRQ